MGQFGSVHSALKMKLLVVLALVACVVAEPEAEAKADPYYYGGYGLGGYYGGYGGYGLGLGYRSYGIGYGGYGGLYGKREAEAEPKADADPYYYGGYGLGGYYGGYRSYGLGLGYRSYGLGYGYGGLYGKREAEAEPKADADPYY